MLVTEPLALAQRSGLCVAGDCRLLLHLAPPDTSLPALRLVNKHSSRGRGTLTAARYSLLRGCDPPLGVSSPPSHANEQSSRRHAIVLARPLWRLFFWGAPIWRSCCLIGGIAPQNRHLGEGCSIKYCIVGRRKGSCGRLCTVASNVTTILRWRLMHQMDELICHCNFSTDGCFRYRQITPRPI